MCTATATPDNSKQLCATAGPRSGAKGAPEHVQADIFSEETVMAVSERQLAADVACMLYAARRGLNAEHLELIWQNLGAFVASTLCNKKVSDPLRLLGGVPERGCLQARVSLSHAEWSEPCL